MQRIDTAQSGETLKNGLYNAFNATSLHEGTRLTNQQYNAY